MFLYAFIFVILNSNLTSKVYKTTSSNSVFVVLNKFYQTNVQEAQF